MGNSILTTIKCRKAALLPPCHRPNMQLSVLLRAAAVARNVECCTLCPHLMVDGHPPPQLLLQGVLRDAGCLLLLWALHLPICALQRTSAARLARHWQWGAAHNSLTMFCEGD